MAMTKAVYDSSGGAYARAQVMPGHAVAKAEMKRETLAPRNDNSRIIVAEIGSGDAEIYFDGAYRLERMARASCSRWHFGFVIWLA